MAVIYHLTLRDAWETALTKGEYAADTLSSEGFIHASEDERQAIGVANRLFVGANDLIALEIDTSHLGSPIKREPGGNGEIYPHIYGPINIVSVARVLTVCADEGGQFSRFGDAQA